MKIQQQDLYHGAALMQIVEHPSFKALNKATPSKYGHYLVNADRHVFVKYRTGAKSSWQFVFGPDEISAVSDQAGQSSTVFLALVCGAVTICALNLDEIRSVLDLGSTQTSQWITVELPTTGSSCWVRGSFGVLRPKIPHNSYPNKVFV